MDLLREIVENNTVTPSLCDILFGEDENTREDLFDTTCDYPKVLYNVCLLYSVLVQAYLITDACKKSKPLKDVIASVNAYKAIIQYWDGDYVYDYDHTKNAVFSLLMVCTEIEDANIFDEQAKESIVTARNAFHRFENKNVRARSDEISEQEFLSLIESFRLLKFTTIDKTTEKITFSVPGQKALTTVCRPFIFFIDQKTRRLTDDSSGHPYVMTSAIKGERNGEFRFSAAELNSYNIIPRSLVITTPVASNENLLLVCKTLDIPTQWYPVGDFMGDYLFLKQLTDISEDVILHILERDRGTYKRTQNILNEVRGLFIDTELYDRIPEFIKVERDNIDKILFELFIKFGVFKTMWCLLFDSKRHAQDEMFAAFLDEFWKNGIITASQRDDYISECNKSISSHIKKLKTILIERTSSFTQRSREITAEWHAFYVLKAAGIKNEKLIADLENVLSIDDYFDMIHNNHTTSEQDLKNVLSFLICFYAPLVEEQFTYQKESYALTVKQVQTDFWKKQRTVQELFDIFINIVRTSYKNELIENLIGREIICDINGLEEYKGIFERSNLSQDTQQYNLIYNKRVFISYAHEDLEKVREIVNLIKTRGFDVFFDEEMFSGGDNWRGRAMDAISSENCIGVVVFMSKAAAASEPVKYELQFARNHAKEKYPDNSLAQDRFIIPVNLEESSISEYLEYYGFSKDVSIREIALDLKKIIYTEKVYFDLNTASLLDNLTQYFEKIIEEDSSGGYTIDADSFKGTALEMANFYTFLKTGTEAYYEPAEVMQAFENGDLSKCVFPLVVSVKEARIKRDNVTLLGYEIVKGKGRGGYGENYILSSKKLTTEDYYCIPNYRRVGENCSWMIEPLLISHECFSKQNPEEIHNGG